MNKAPKLIIFNANKFLLFITIKKSSDSFPNFNDLENYNNQ